jgi:hypothetical protein
VAHPQLEAHQATEVEVMVPVEVRHQLLQEVAKMVQYLVKVEQLLDQALLELEHLNLVPWGQVDKMSL